MCIRTSNILKLRGLFDVYFYRIHFKRGLQCYSVLSLVSSGGTTENAGVEKAGVDSRSGKCRSKSYGTPNRDYFGRILSYLNLVR